MIEKSPYKDIYEWRKLNFPEFRAAQVKGILDDICDDFGWERYKHLANKKKRKGRSKGNGFWDYEKSKQSALDCTTREEWGNKYSGAQRWARRNGYYVEFTAHMPNRNTVNQYHWEDKERCFKNAKKYSNYTKWCVNSPSAMAAAKRKGWLTDICKDNNWVINIKHRWNDELCIEDSKSYPSYEAWAKVKNGSYNYAIKNNLIVKIRKINNWVEVIWDKELSIEDSKKFIIYGEWKRNGKDSYKYAKEHGFIAEIIEINGWKTNKRILKTIEDCIKDSKNYNSITEWYTKSATIYAYSGRKKWLNEIFEINGWERSAKYHRNGDGKYHRNGDGKIWTKELCIEDSKQHETCGKWMKKSKSAYTYAKNNGFYSEILAYFYEKSGKKPAGFWDIKENIIESINDCKTKKEWIGKYRSALLGAVRNGWLKEIYKINGWDEPKYNKEFCLKDSQEYDGKTEWRRESINTYQFAQKNGWLKEIYKINGW